MTGTGTAAAPPTIALSKVCRTFLAGDVETWALCDVDLAVQSGEFVAIMGPSGCGKSSLLNIIGLMDGPTLGQVSVLGAPVARADERALCDLRRRHVGFVFQNFNLIGDLTIWRNVEVGLLYRGVARSERAARVDAALAQVGLSARARHYPHQLSGGQQQRVGMARALVGRPAMLMADEPAGNLDSANGAAIMALLRAQADTGTTVVMVTHNPAHAEMADRTITLADGRIIGETRPADPEGPLHDSGPIGFVR